MWASLHTAQGRRRHGLFLAEGEHMAGEALKARAANALLLDESEQQRFKHFLDSGLPGFLMPGQVLSKVSSVKTPQGILAVCPVPPPIPIKRVGSRVVALNGVQDPGNVGTILRTVDAAGFAALILDGKTADPYGPKALRATMGAIFRVPVLAVPRLEDALKSLDGYDILAGDLDGTDFYARPHTQKPVCLLIGSEGSGLEESVKKCATQRVRLPMMGPSESLNAGVAAAVMMYEFLRRDLAYCPATKG